MTVKRYVRLPSNIQLDNKAGLKYKKILKFCDQQSTSHKLSACFPAPHHPPLEKKKNTEKASVLGTPVCSECHAIRGCEMRCHS